jgi:hypothetical protein
MRYAIASLALVLITGCAARQNLKSENAELKARVSALETQVADLHVQNAKLAGATTTTTTTLAIDGLKLEPPKLGELRYTPPPPGGSRTFNGPSRFITVADTTGLTVGGLNMVGSGILEHPTAGTLIYKGDLQVGGVGQTVTIHKSAGPATSTATTATTTKTIPAATPQK